MFQQRPTEAVRLAVITMSLNGGEINASATDSHSVSTRDSSTQGLTGCSSGWGFSASRFSLESLDGTTHDHELLPDEDRRVHVHFDSYSMGVGGYDSWSPNVDDHFVLSKDKPSSLVNKPCVTTIRANGRDVKVAQTSIRLAPLYA